MNKLILLGAFTLTVNLSLFGQAKNWNTLEKNDYSIEYPEDWELDESGQMGTRFVLLSPLASPDDKFGENVNLLVQDLSGYNLDLEKYVEASEDQVKTLITNGKIIESKRIKNQALNYQRMIFTGKQGIFDLKFEQYYWVVGDKAYVLTLACEENQFDHYRMTGEKILNSFKLN